MSDRSAAIRSERVLVRGELCPACIHVRDGRVAKVAGWSDAARLDLHDYGDAVVMPGLVDTHVHINEPGRTEWEGFETATRAAAAGGVTTVLDMPLNSIPATTTVAALAAKRAVAVDRCSVDVGFLGGVVPGNVDELEPLWNAGVFAFKCFLVPSGVDEFPAVGEADLRRALPVLASLGAPLMVHAELAEHLLPMASDDHRKYAVYLASRPPKAETQAIELVARLAAEYQARVHIVHVSSGDAISVIRRARSRGAAISAETCPHYLTFAAGSIPDGATEFKCAPPIREAVHREALWQALARGELDCVVSDHSPCTSALKRQDTGDFAEAWGGIASLQLGLSATWRGAHERGHTAERFAEWMSGAPARLVGLEQRKGALDAGYDADIVVWNPDEPNVVRAEALFHRHPLTPYLGRALRGRVHTTWIGGRIAYADGAVSAAPVGRLLSREHR